MSKSILITAICTIAFSYASRAQEMSTAVETQKYYPEKVPSDVIDIYNQELNAAGSILPWTELHNIATLTMQSKFTMDDKTRNRTVKYDHAKNELIISMEGKNNASKMTSTVMNGVFTKTMAIVKDGKEKQMMKEVKMADANGRLVRFESYYNSDTGWVLQSLEKATYRSLKNGLMLEIREKGLGDYVNSDSIWYVFDEKGVLLKKSDPFNRWNFTYNEKGQIKMLEWVQKDILSSGETLYTTAYQYNKEGLPVFKSAEDKYYNSETKLLYNSAGKVVVKTRIKRGDNEVKEISSFNYDNKGSLSYIGQSLDGNTTVKAAVKCDFNGNIISIEGNQFPAASKIEFKNGQGSTSSSVEGPGKIEQTITITYR